MGEGTVRRHDQQITVRDGQHVVARVFDWQPTNAQLRKRNHTALPPVLVIPDPSRTMDAVTPMIEALLTASDRPATAVTFDGVGRGGASSGSREMSEAADDLIDVCDALGLHHIAVVALGGGVRTLLASGPKRPTLTSRIALIDGGPTLDSVGIARAAALRKKAVAPKDWTQATEVARAIAPGQFPALSETDWLAIARSIWRDERGKLLPMVPPTEVDESALWQELAIFKRVPALLLRGETSPLITTELATSISKRHGRMLLGPVAGQGHVPYLRTAEDVAPLVDFLAV
ncbi:MAG: alpha/beta hydrolase [Pseudomonadota bacterium]